MTWSETNLMDQRVEFVLKSFEGRTPFTELCKEYNISRKTGYKWRNRFMEEGYEGMYEQSRRPNIRAMSNTRTENVKTAFEKAFELYGLPQIIRSDNGSPFAASNSPLGLSRLSSWWLSLGISLDRIDPGCPYQNGGHERS